MGLVPFTFGHGGHGWSFLIFLMFSASFFPLFLLGEHRKHGLQNLSNPRHVQQNENAEKHGQPILLWKYRLPRQASQHGLCRQHHGCR